MKKESLKWIIVIVVVLAVAAVSLFSCSGNDRMSAVSEDGVWEAYAMETTEDGQKAWRGVVVYNGDNPEDIKNVRTQVCINGKKGKYIKRQLTEAGTLGIQKSDAGGEKEFYIFMKAQKQKPASVSVKVKWKEKGTTRVEKMWLIGK